MSNTINKIMNVEWTMVVLFVLLKLTGIVSWSWWWIVMCVFFYPVLFIAFIILGILSVITATIIEELWRFFCILVNGR